MSAWCDDGNRGVGDPVTTILIFQHVPVGAFILKY